MCYLRIIKKKPVRINHQVCIHEFAISLFAIYASAASRPVGRGRHSRLYFDVGLCTELNRAGILQSGRVIYLFICAPTGHGLFFSCPVPRSGFVRGKKMLTRSLTRLLTRFLTRLLSFIAHIYMLTTRNSHSILFYPSY